MGLVPIREALALELPRPGDARSRLLARDPGLDDALADPAFSRVFGL
jgi:hypothetical protein